MSDHIKLMALAFAATPGPWLSNAVAPGDDQDEELMVYRALPEAGEKAVSVLFNADWASEADIAFVAACREAVPGLVAEIERLERMCESLIKTAGQANQLSSDVLDERNQARNALSDAEALGKAREAAFREELATSQFCQERDALQQRLTVAEQRAGDLESVLINVRETLGREYWDQYAGLDETRDILDAALKPAEGEGS